MKTNRRFAHSALCVLLAAALALCAAPAALAEDGETLSGTAETSRQAESAPAQPTEKAKKSTKTDPAALLTDPDPLTGLSVTADGLFTYACTVQAGVRTASLVRYTGSAASVTLPDTLHDAAGEGYLLTAIADGTPDGGAFAGNTSLTDIALPNTLEQVGGYAFYNCTALAGPLVLPAGLRAIGPYAFAGCTSLTLGEETLGLSALNGIQAGIFMGCAALNGGLSLPRGPLKTEGRAVLGENAFAGCAGLTGALTIPEGFTAVGAGAFSGCTGFDGGLSLPVSLREIGAESFLNCTGLSGPLMLQPTLAGVGASAFGGCASFTRAVFKGRCPTLDATAFTGCTAPDFALYYIVDPDGKWRQTQMPEGCAVYQQTAAVSLNSTARTLRPGDTAPLVASVSPITPGHRANQAVVWSSSDEAVATVDQGGNVRAIAPGAAQITAATRDGLQKTAVCEIRVESG